MILRIYPPVYKETYFIFLIRVQFDAYLPQLILIRWHRLIPPVLENLIDDF